MCRKQIRSRHHIGSSRVFIGIPLLVGILLLPVAVALPLPTPPPQTGAAHASAHAQAHAAQPQVCFTAVFSRPLPGKADYCLGMHDWNRGHYREGLEFLELAAGWGNKNAQYTLGLIHYAGHHVSTNVPLGLAWLQLADQRHNDPQISRVKHSAFKSATPAQRHKAEGLFNQMAGKYGDKVATARAWHRLQHWERRHNRFNSGCIRITGAQAAAARRLGLVGVPPAAINGLLFATQANGQPVINPTKKQRRIYRNARSSGACVTLHMRQHVTHKLAAKYFAGWIGTVTVEPLKAVPAPASSGH